MKEGIPCKSPEACRLELLKSLIARHRGQALQIIKENNIEVELGTDGQISLVKCPAPGCKDVLIVGEK